MELILEEFDEDNVDDEIDNIPSSKSSFAIIAAMGKAPVAPGELYLSTCKERLFLIIMVSSTNFPFLSIKEDLMPAVPLCIKDDGLSWGKNSLALFIMAVLESELFNSLLASNRNCLFRNIFRAPVLDDSKIFGIKYLTLVLQLYA